MIMHQQKLHTKPHVNKNLKKEIMERSNLKNIASESSKIEDKKRYKIQQNVCKKCKGLGNANEM